jgi:predicted  nucleic acid-binding Zn-ribbon protein
MNEPAKQSEAGAFEQAAERLDRAVMRLEQSVVNARGRLAALDSAEADVRRLSSERTRLAAELDRAQSRARRLDDKASEVSRRLVDAMEGVKTVLSGGAG